MKFCQCLTAKQRARSITKLKKRFSMREIKCKQDGARVKCAVKSESIELSRLRPHHPYPLPMNPTSVFLNFLLAPRPWGTPPEIFPGALVYTSSNVSDRTCLKSHQIFCETPFSPSCPKTASYLLAAPAQSVSCSLLRIRHAVTKCRSSWLAWGSRKTWRAIAGFTTKPCRPW